MPIVAVFAVAMLLLSACGSSSSSGPEEDRQFATDTRPAATSAPTETPSDAASVDPTATSASVDPASVLKSRGAPKFYFAELRGTLISVKPSEPALAPVVMDIPAGYRVLAFDASPDGSQVAVLLGNRNDSTAPISFAIFTHDGDLALHPIVVLDAASLGATPVSAATPVAADASSTVFVSWAAQGDRILVGSASGALVNVTPAGEATRITLDRLDGTLASASWSPRGGSILLRVRDAEGRGAIGLATIEDGAGHVQTLWPPADERRPMSVEEIAWLPDGSGVLFLQEDLASDTGAGAQLYQVSVSGGNPTVVASPGRGGPSASIGDFTVSPDGKSVAYTIIIPDGDDWVFHSLWVRSLRATTSYEVSVGNVDGVSEIGWASGGFLWCERTEENGPVEALRVVTLDEQSLLLATTRGSSAASPIASPQASPVGTPAASPVATPQASPVATPVP